MIKQVEIRMKWTDFQVLFATAYTIENMHPTFVLNGCMFEFVHQRRDGEYIILTGMRLSP
jgi:hypothetical protein